MLGVYINTANTGYFVNPQFLHFFQEVNWSWNLLGETWTGQKSEYSCAVQWAPVQLAGTSRCQASAFLNCQTQWVTECITEPRRRTSLMETITSYRRSCEEVPQARVLLLGPVSSGKSSFISSVRSVFNGRVTNWAMVGSFSSGFTKKVHEEHLHVF